VPRRAELAESCRRTAKLQSELVNLVGSRRGPAIHGLALNSSVTLSGAGWPGPLPPKLTGLRGKHPRQCRRWGRSPSSRFHGAKAGCCLKRLESWAAGPGCPDSPPPGWREQPDALGPDVLLLRRAWPQRSHRPRGGFVLSHDPRGSPVSDVPGRPTWLRSPLAALSEARGGPPIGGGPRKPAPPRFHRFLRHHRVRANPR